MSLGILKNNFISVGYTKEKGIIEEIKFKNHSMNWVVSSDVIRKFGFSELESSLLGKSLININGTEFNTGHMKPSIKCKTNEIIFCYDLNGIELKHIFKIEANKLHWSISIINTRDDSVYISKLINWLPVSYIMFENITDNFINSCSMIPTISEDYSNILCKKRDGIGPDLLIVNNGSGLKSVGSLCRYKNLFFEQSAPSLSGLVLYNVVNCYDKPINKAETFDWLYEDMYKGISLLSGENFTDSYEFFQINEEESNDSSIISEVPVIDYPSMVIIGHPESIKINFSKSVKSYQIYSVNKDGMFLERIFKLDNRFTNVLDLPDFTLPGERKVILIYEDGSKSSVIFPVYNSISSFIEAFCNYSYNKRFISDRNNKFYGAYSSVSQQGESCAKGSLLLLKNKILPTNKNEVEQVEINTALYLKKRWLNDDFTAVKQYPGGFARIFDMDYLIMQFYLLSTFENSLLKLNDSNTYLIWAYQTAIYTMEKTDDKLPREVVETEIASMISWIELEMIETLKIRGFVNESINLKSYWNKHIAVQESKVKDKSFVETEHYFDNCGISMVSETLLNSGKYESGLEAASLLLANVGESNDYRNWAPDRWWEALSFMYHNLWAVFSAKAMLTAYEKSLDNRYLFTAYKSMMPMFYNYNWNALSAENRINPGEGLSAYCITNPNLNLDAASRNRFGQSIFEDDFFEGIDVAGDDWDLGADLIVYLLTFGQKTYITQVDNLPHAVNGRLEVLNNRLRIYSYAAYPKSYYLEDENLTIFSESKNYTIKWIELEKGVCKTVGLNKTSTTNDFNVDIYMLTQNKKERLNLEVIWV